MGRIEHFHGFTTAASARIAALLLIKRSAHEIAEAIEVLVEVLDLLGGDPEVKDNDDAPEDDDPGGCEHDGREIDDGY